MADTMIEVNSVSKVFRVPHEKYTSLKQNAVHLFAKKKYSRFEAVNDVSFEVKRGEFFGIVGRNGSGKSTLLKMLAGIYVPTSGHVKINGSLSPFIELGVGFNPELSARDNVFLNGAILGLTRAQIRERFDEIIAFAELEEFVDQKLKNFSSGMQVRLAFSIAIRAQSEILLIDEVLAVGDANFQSKCYEVFRKMKSEGKTVVFVSHDVSAIREFCDRAIFIEDSRLKATGTVEEVIQLYNASNLERLAQGKEPGEEPSPQEPSPERPIEVVSCKLTNQNGKEVNLFHPNDKIVVEVSYKAHKEVESPVYGIVIKSVGDARIFFATNTKVDNIKTGTIAAGKASVYRVELPNHLGPGHYFVSPAVASRDGQISYDWHEDYVRFFSGGWRNEISPLQVDYRSKIA